MKKSTTNSLNVKVNSSVIRQKGESQNGCFKKTKHAKFSEKRTFPTPWYILLSPTSKPFFSASSGKTCSVHLKQKTHMSTVGSLNIGLILVITGGLFKNSKPLFSTNNKHMYPARLEQTNDQ